MKALTLLFCVFILLNGCHSRPENMQPDGRQQENAKSQQNATQAAPCVLCSNFVKTGPAQCYVGDEVLFTIEINSFETVEQNVTIVEKIPQGFIFLDSNHSPSGIQGQKVTWDMGLFSKDRSESIEVWLQAVKAGIWLNTAVLITGEYQPVSTTAITQVK